MYPFVVRCVLLLLTIAVTAVPARAQSSVSIGAPLEGEVVLNRDVEVRIAPSENGRILTTLTKGKALNALGTPRGTNWTQVAVGGIPLGFVPADSLDPVYAPKYAVPNRTAGVPGAPPATGPTLTGAALVSEKARAAVADAAAQGLMVATRGLTVTEMVDGKKRRSVSLRKGQVVGLAAVNGSRLELFLSNGRRAEASLDGFLGVAAAYSDGERPKGGAFVGRLGEYLSYEEGLRAWQSFIAGSGQGYRDRPPIVWPVFRSGRILFQAGVGPLSAADLDRSCAALTRQGVECAPIELKVF